jgi:hypothetical protein
MRFLGLVIPATAEAQPTGTSMRTFLMSIDELIRSVSLGRSGRP